MNSIRRRAVPRDNFEWKTVVKSIPTGTSPPDTMPDEDVIKAGAVAFEKTPVSTSDSWDASTAVAGLRKWAGVENKDDLKDAAKRQKYGRGFALITGDGEDFGDYHLPHHQVDDGKLVLNKHGLYAAAARIDQTAMPEAEKSKVKHHLEQEYGVLGEEAPWKKTEKAVDPNEGKVGDSNKYPRLNDISAAESTDKAIDDHADQISGEYVEKPYPHEHAARMHEPGDFQSDSFRRIGITDGISAIIARPKGSEKTKVQAYRFDRSKFTAEQAHAWLSKHNLKPKNFEAAKETDKVDSGALDNGGKKVPAIFSPASDLTDNGPATTSATGAPTKKAVGQINDDPTPETGRGQKPNVPAGESTVAKSPGDAVNSDPDPKTTRGQTPNVAAGETSLDKTVYAPGTPNALNMSKATAPILTPAKIAEEEPENVYGGFDYVEGEQGVGILQTHEQGLLLDQTTLNVDFGWKTPLKLSEEELTRLSLLCGVDVKPQYEAALGEDGETYEFERYVRALHKLRDVLSPEDKELVLKALPSRIHTDIRLVRNGDAYWEGGEVQTPGTQYGKNVLLDIQAGEGDKVRVSMDYGVYEGTTSAYRKGEVIRGSLVWMHMGIDGPQILGDTWSGPWGDYSRFQARAAFTWTAGLQTTIYKEFMFSGPQINGLWVFKYGCWSGYYDGWALFKPEDQTPRSEKLKTVSKALKTCNILKSDEEKRIVTGIVLQPEVVDAQGDIYSEDVIGEAAANFLADYNRQTELGLQHKMFGNDVQLISSWVSPVDFILGGQTIKKGSWLMSVRILDDKIWEAVKSGKITGFSIGGVAKVQRMNE